MRVTLMNAVSADGLIATRDGDSDWVSDLDGELFENRCVEAGCIVVGRKTYEQYQGELYPMAGVLNIVLTSGESKNEERVVFANSPKEAIEEASKAGYEEVILVGGSHANTAFLNAGLINEIILDVHPLLLGDGMSVFANKLDQLKLELLGSRVLGEGLVQLHYKVIK